MTRAARVATIAALLLLAAPAGAQPGAPEPATLRGDSTQTRKRLAEAEQKILGGKAADAADDLQRLLDESGDDLITLDGKQYRAARWVAHSLLAKLPPDVLKAYQDRIDQPAKKLLEQAKQSRDPRPLWQLLDRYFVSRPSDAALVLLGELLFERGEFRAAEDAWRKLLPDAGADPAYPGSKADPVLVRARVALAVVFQSDTGRAKAEVAAFKAKYPTATGALAGKNGPFADTLQTYLVSPPKLAPDATSGTAWPTYGGAPDRAGRVPGGIPRAWPGRPTWAKDIPAERGEVVFQRPNNPPTRQPFGHPVIINDEVFVTDGVRVRGFNLHSGEPTRSYRPLIPVNIPDAGRVLEPICTLSASDGMLYTRIGGAAVRPPAPGVRVPESFVVCLNAKLSERWRLSTPEDEKIATAWEGAPLVSDRRLWAVYAKFEGGRVVHVAACYDPADAEQDIGPGRPAWTAELCDSPMPVVGGERNRQELLTLAGRHLVFCSNNGAVVAVDALTGRRAWGFRYPRARNTAGLTGDPAPAVAFGGRVFVAPVDGEHVYALDAETGALVWESGLTEGARILGVARGRLVVAVAGPLRGIRGLNLETGSYREGGWIAGDVNLPLSYGQGLVTDDDIVWPTRSGLFVLDARAGLPASPGPNPRLGPANEKFFGHIAYANGVLVVVTATQVRGYVAQSKKIEPRPDLPPRERFDLFADRAEREVAAGNPAKARAVLAEAVASDLPAPLRAWAAARMLQLSTPTTDSAGLPTEVRDAFRGPLLTEWVLPPDGVPVTLEELLRRHLGRPAVAGSAPACTTDRGPIAHTLTTESDIAHTLKLPPAVAPLALIPGAGPPKRLFASGPNSLVTVPLDQSKMSEHLTTDLFTHAAEVRNWFVAAGPLAVALYGTVREPLWVFRVPIDALPSGEGASRAALCGDEPTRPHLSSFVLAGPWLLARVGAHHLIALDLPARRVAWVLNTGGRAGYEPAQFPGAVRFGPHVAVCGKFAVVQLSNGRRWFVELVTGRPVALPALGEHTARVWWPHAPADLGANRLLVADGPGLVRLLQFDGRVKWAYEPTRDDGLTGEPAQVWVRGDVLLIAVRRNHGVEIDRVHLADGKPAWTGTAFADADRIDLPCADADSDRVYVPAANKLLALVISNGKCAWETDLPDARSAKGWVVRAGKSCVIAYPAEAIPAEPPGAVFDRLARSFAREPFVWRLPGLAATLYDAWVARAVPVLLFDPETGKALGRFDIPARGPAVTAWFDADRAVIATGDRVVWLK